MGHSDRERPLSRDVEKRASVRVIYETILMCAEYNGETFPHFSQFWEVKTKDLSATGVAFHSPKLPKTTLLLLMFGNPQANPIFVKARVARHVESSAADGTDYLIGCELLERLKN